MQLWRNKEDKSLAVSKSWDDVSTGSGDVIVIGEDGEDGTIDTADWEQISLEDFMKEIGDLRIRFNGAKKIAEDNVPSMRILG